MLVIQAKNVNDALETAIRTIKTAPQLLTEIAPRGMRTLEFKAPVSTVYTKPEQCVLFNPVRDANPYFHFMEAIWMLAGRSDVAFLSKFNGNIANYSDDGVSFHGAYGERWHRGHQLQNIVELLRNDPDTRRAVLAIYQWDKDHWYSGKDLPCNDIVFFKIRDSRLHMRVCCRSNDLIWGAYGANAVHFSILQQFVAAAVGVKVGTYTQISDSLHMYLDLNDIGARLLRAVEELPSAFDCGYPVTGNIFSYENNIHEEDVQVLMKACGLFCTQILRNRVPYSSSLLPKFKFLQHGAYPMVLSWLAYKQGNTTQALKNAESICFRDWSNACVHWLLRRQYKNSEEVNIPYYHPLYWPSKKGNA